MKNYSSFIGTPYHAGAFNKLGGHDVIPIQLFIWVTWGGIIADRRIELVEYVGVKSFQEYLPTFCESLN